MPPVEVEEDRLKRGRRAVRVVLAEARARSGRHPAYAAPKPEDLAAAREALSKIDGNETLQIVRAGMQIFHSMLID